MLYIIRKIDRNARVDYVDFITEPIGHCDDVRIIGFNDRPKPRLLAEIAKKLCLAMPWLQKPLARCMFDKEFLRAVAQIRPEDNVLLFDIWNLGCQRAIRQQLGRKQVSTFIWDSVRAFYRSSKLQKRYMRALERYGLAIHTFDQLDAKTYGFKLVPQVYREVEAASELESVGAFYIGSDIGRTQCYVDLARRLKAEGVDFKMMLLPAKGSPLSDELRPYYISEHVPYERLLGEVRRSKSVIEVLKPGQSGWTLRTLEALFLGKKLITNNESIVSAPFYHPSNIYVLGKDDSRLSIAEFLAQPMHPVSDELKHPYDIKHWIKQFE